MDNSFDINNIELQQEDRIMSYLRGQMTHEEEVGFMEDLQEDPVLKDRAVTMARLAKGMSQVGVGNDNLLKEALFSTSEDKVKEIVKQVINKQKKSSYRRKYITLLSIAASLLLIVSLGYFYRDYNRTVALGNQYAMKFEPTQSRGIDSDVDKEVETLINNVYNKIDLSQTLKRLEVLWEVSTLDTYNAYTEFAPEIGWALATGYLKDNNKKEASFVLAKMAILYGDDMVLSNKIRELQVKVVEP